MRNEKTSKRVATIAGRVLRDLARGLPMDLCVTTAELKALAASVLTQAEDKPKRKKGARPPS
jgi:hypothetical protein